jgi:hypothetical protein
MFSEVNFHTLFTQLLATAAVVVAFVHPGSHAFNVSDASVVAAATVAASIASALERVVKPPVTTRTAVVPIRTAGHVTGAESAPS